MKALFSFLAIALLLVGSANAGDDTSWFDMKNCEICKPMAENPELMKNMSWEHHDLSNGMACVTKVTPEFMDDYRKTHAAMDAVIKRAQAGEQVNMCNM